jgi:hypothetical protein
MLILEIFSGKNSIKSIANDMGFEVVSMAENGEADMIVDILTWDFTEYETGMFHMIWFRMDEFTNELIQQALEIMEHFVPKHWILEGPTSLGDEWFMYGIPFNDLTLCKYNCMYYKKIRVYNNIYDWKPRPLCNFDCSAMNESGTRHKPFNESKNVLPVEYIKSVLMKIN